MRWPRAFLVAAIIAISVEFSAVHGGLIDLLNSNSDQGLAQQMNTVFKISKNEGKVLLTGEDNTPIQEAVTFWCTHRGSDTMQQVFLDDPDVATKIDLKKPISFVIHGWTDDGDKVWVQSTVLDVKKFFDTNSCAVNWGHLARFEYFKAATNHTLVVSGYLTEFLRFLNGKGLPFSKVTLIGHSLGAQVAGQTGYNLEGQIGQIYGLDPAGPLFTSPSDRGLQYRLDRTDAKYVQVIISSRHLTGVGVGDGHENFYPNGGSAPQTNCVLPVTSDAEFADMMVCSHNHAVTLFRLSLDPALVYQAKQCDDWSSYTLGFCLLKKTNRLGVHSSKIGGNFYLKTSPFAPYQL